MSGFVILLVITHVIVGVLAYAFGHDAGRLDEKYKPSGK